MRFKNNFEKDLFGNGCILAATIFWGVNYPFTKALAPSWMPANAISATRLVGGAMLFWLASLFLKTEELDRKSLLRSFFGGLALAGCLILFVLSLNYGSAIDISIIMTLPPVFVLLIEAIFLRRHPSLLEYGGVLLSFIGAAMVILTGSSSSGAASDYLLGDFLAIISSTCFAIYLVVLAKPSKIYKPISLLRWVFLFGSLPALFLVPSFFESRLVHSTNAIPWLELAFILLGPTFLAYLLTQPAMRTIGAVLVALYQYLTPVVAALAAMAMGIDKPRWSQGAAMLIIITGMLLTNFGRDKAQAKKAN